MYCERYEVVVSLGQDYSSSLCAPNSLAVIETTRQLECVTQTVLLDSSAPGLSYPIEMYVSGRTDITTGDPLTFSDIQETGKQH